MKRLVFDYLEPCTQIFKEHLPSICFQTGYKYSNYMLPSQQLFRFFLTKLPMRSVSSTALSR